MTCISSARHLLGEVTRELVTDAEDYTGVESQTVPNASMTLEDIYRRMAQGIPMDLSGQFSQRLEQGEDRATFEDLDDYRPYRSPAGTLERRQEIEQRAETALNRLNEAQSTETVVEETPEAEEQANKPDYAELRAKAKQEKRDKNS